MAEPHHTVYFDIQDALAEPGCALCQLALRSLRNYFNSMVMVYESVNDPGIRAAIRAAHGFCEVHGRMLREAHAAMHRDHSPRCARGVGGRVFSKDVHRAIH